MKKISLSYLNVEELFSLSKDSIKTANNLLNSHQLLQISRNVIVEQMPYLEASINYNASSVHTQKLKDFDDNRDTLFKGLKSYIGAFLVIGNQQQKAAAAYLVRIIETIGVNLYLENYTVETTLMQQLLKKFREPQSMDALNVLQAVQVVDNLTAAEQEFELVFNQKLETEGSTTSPAERLNARNQIILHLQFIFQAVDILAEHTNDSQTKAVKQTLDNILSAIMTTVRARKTRQENKKDADDTTIKG